MGKSGQGYSGLFYLLSAAVTAAVFALCVCVGSVNLSLGDTLSAIWRALGGKWGEAGVSDAIIIGVRLPRVICVALVGAALSLCGAAMQGLLRNPLADGSTLGVSAGASLGAVLAIALGISLPGLANTGITGMAMAFAFLSLVCILALAQRLDSGLSTNTIILIGVIFSMFANAIISLVVTFAGDRVRSVLFWTLGSLAGSTWRDVVTLLVALGVCGAVLMLHATELNAFAIGEDNARHVGINVKRVKLVVLVTVSALIGVCVSISGTIGFVGLVIPHIIRMLTGPNHGRLLPAALFGGAVFLMLADLASRVLLRPRELPIGVVTSIIGAAVFIYIFYMSRRVR